MAKPPAQRIADTLNYLQNTAIVTGPERQHAYQLVQDFVNAAFPNPALPAYTQFSESLSLGFHLLSDPNEFRKMTRALFLLWKAMKHFDNAFTMPYPNISQINQGTAQRVLTNYIRKARCQYERIHGGNAGANHVLTQVFPANPLQFLRDNNVYVAGSGALDAGQAPQNVQASKFDYNPGRDRYEFGVGHPVGNGAVGIQVESVTAFHWTNPRYLPPPPPPHQINTVNFNNVTGIELSGAHLMVTTQFTGCAFCMAEHAGHMYCAHISPYVPGIQPSTEGTPLAQRVMATGAFGNAGGTAPRVYGRNVGSVPNPNGYDIGAGGGGGTYMTIVGFPGGVTYNIYSQTTHNNRIADSRQIF